MKECEGRVSANVLMSLNVQSHSSDDSVKPPANRRPHSSAVKGVDQQLVQTIVDEIIDR